MARRPGRWRRRRSWRTPRALSLDQCSTRAKPEALSVRLFVLFFTVRVGWANTPRVNVTVTQLTDQLLASYARVGGINHLDGKNLPSKTTVCSITVDLLRLLFPGFFHERVIHSSELKVETAALMDSVLGRLEDEIYKSLEYRTPEGMTKKELRPAARATTLEFLSNLPSVRELL